MSDLERLAQEYRAKVVAYEAAHEAAEKADAAERAAGEAARIAYKEMKVAADALLEGVGQPSDPLTMPRSMWES